MQKRRKKEVVRALQVQARQEWQLHAVGQAARLMLGDVEQSAHFGQAAPAASAAEATEARPTVAPIYSGVMTAPIYTVQ